MDFRILRRMAHFLAVAEEGHFGRAAARLGMSQPPLSAQIQALEAELGVELLERTRKGARPTREGEALLPVIRRLAEDAKQVEALARELRAGRQMPMALACVTSALFDFLPPLVRGPARRRSPMRRWRCRRWTPPMRWRRCAAARWISPSPGSTATGRRCACCGSGSMRWWWRCRRGMRCSAIPGRCRLRRWRGSR